MALYSSILAWRIPWTEGPGGLQSMGHKESDITEHTCTNSDIVPIHVHPPSLSNETLSVQTSRYIFLFSRCNNYSEFRV